MTSTGEKCLFVKTYSRKCPVWKDEKFVTTGLKARTLQSVKQPQFLKNHRIYPEAWSKTKSEEERFISLSQRRSRRINPLKNISNVNGEATLRVTGKRIGSSFYKKKPSSMPISRGHLDLIEESETEFQDFVNCNLATSTHTANFRSVQRSDAVQLLPVTATPAVSECSSIELSDDDSANQQSDIGSVTDSMETMASDFSTPDLDTSTTLSVSDECILDIGDTDEDSTLCCSNSTMTTMKAATSTDEEDEETFPDMEKLRRDLPDSEEIARPLEPVQFSFLHKLTSKSFAGKAKGLLPLIKVSKVTPKKRPSLAKYTATNRANSTLQREMGLGIHDYQSAGELSDIPVDKNLEEHWNMCADNNLNSTPMVNAIGHARYQPDVSSIQGSINHMKNVREVVSAMDATSICEVRGDHGRPGNHQDRGDCDGQDDVVLHNTAVPAKRPPRSVYSFTTSDESSDTYMSCQQFPDTSVLKIHGKKLLSQPIRASKSSAIRKQGTQFTTSVGSHPSKQVSFSLSANREKEYHPELSIRSAQLHLPSISPSTSILKKRSANFVDKAAGNDCATKQTSTPNKRKRHRGRKNMMEYSFDVSAVALPGCNESELIIQDTYSMDTLEETITPTKMSTVKEVISQLCKSSSGSAIEQDLQTLMIRGETTPSMRVKRSSRSVAPTLPKSKRSRQTPGLSDSLENQPSAKQAVNRRQLFKNQSAYPPCCIESFNHYSYLPAKVVQYKSPIKYDQNIPEDILTLLPGTVRL